MSAVVTRQHWIQCMTFAAETNAMHVQRWLGRQRSMCSGGVTDKALAVAAWSRWTDGHTHGHTHTYAERHNTFSTRLSGAKVIRISVLL